MGINKLCISTDSQFLINAVTLWIKGWKAKNWHLKTGDRVKNEVDFKELDSLLQDESLDVKWVSCKYKNEFNRLCKYFKFNCRRTTSRRIKASRVTRWRTSWPKLVQKFISAYSLV